MKTLLASLAVSLLLISCEKDSVYTEEGYRNIEEPAIPHQSYRFADATLQASYHSTVVDSALLGQLTLFKGYGTASFRNRQTNQSEYPTKVELEGTTLQNLQGLYQNQPGKTSGIDFGTSVHWKVIGAGNIPSIDQQVLRKVPEIGNISLGDSLNSQKALELRVDTANPYTDLGVVDSISLRIIGQQGEYEQRSSYLEPTLVVESRDLRELGEGPAYLQLSVFKVEIQEQNGYRIAFVNKGVFSRRIFVY